MLQRLTSDILNKQSDPECEQHGGNQMELDVQTEKHRKLKCVGAIILSFSLFLAPAFALDHNAPQIDGRVPHPFRAPCEKGG